MKHEFVCPKCNAPPNACGRKPTDICDGSAGNKECIGFICECEDEASNLDEHGTTLADPCPNANCYHCGWGGTHPVPPKGLQPWEKKALKAGWTMPEARRKELER